MIFKEAFKWVEAELEGRIATTKEACGVLAEHIGSLKGDHVEIGALYGATAVLAALVKSDGMVFTIDPVDEYGYYGGDDYHINSRPTQDILRRNFEHFGVSERIVHVNAFSHPFPVRGILFDSAFIDGDHTYSGVMQDIQSLKTRVIGPMIFDNAADPVYPGVKQAVMEFVDGGDFHLIDWKHNVGVVASSRWIAMKDRD